VVPFNAWILGVNKLPVEVKTEACDVLLEELPVSDIAFDVCMVEVCRFCSPDDELNMNSLPTAVVFGDVCS
jgi:hypothetical protein